MDIGHEQRQKLYCSFQLPLMASQIRIKCPSIRRTTSYIKHCKKIDMQEILKKNDKTDVIPDGQSCVKHKKIEVDMEKR
ncbi:hypothetical protein Avbf_15239 [Armadillidium vulgare]|nr:hypothetical protein Avbf_15239 [Armadillidium vulgare]